MVDAEVGRAAVGEGLPFNGFRGAVPAGAGILVDVNFFALAAGEGAANELDVVTLLKFKTEVGAGSTTPLYQVTVDALVILVATVSVGQEPVDFEVSWASIVEEVSDVNVFVFVAFCDWGCGADFAVAFNVSRRVAALDVGVEVESLRAPLFEGVTV